PRRFAVLVAGLPLALYASGLLVPVLLDLPNCAPALAGGLALVAYAAFRPALRREPQPVSVRTHLGWLAALAPLAGVASQGTPAAGRFSAPRLALAAAAACLGAGRFAPLLLPLALLPGLESAPESWSARGAVPRAPDVLLISVDTLRA